VSVADTGAPPALPAWLAHLVLVDLLGPSGTVLAADPIAAPLQTGQVKPLGGRICSGISIRPLAQGGALLTIADPIDRPAADSLAGPVAVIAAADGDLAACSAARPDLVLWIGSAPLPAGLEAIDPGLPGLAAADAAVEALRAPLTRQIAALSGGAQHGEPDALDRLRSMAERSGTLRPPGQNAAGEIELALDPLACLRVPVRAEAIAAIRAGRVLLHRDRPVGLRLPCLSMTAVAIEIVLGHGAWHALGAVQSRDGLYRGRTEGAEQTVLHLQSRRKPALWIDATVAGHGLWVEEIRVVLPPPPREALPAPADPLAHYADPLAAYDPGHAR